MKENDKLQILKPTASAIFDIARELGMIKEIYNELSECSKLFQDIDIKKYFFDKSISKKDKKELIDKRLKPILSKETYAFVSILTEHDSIDVLPDIAALYKEIADDYSNQMLDDNIYEQYDFIKEHILPLIHYLILDLKKYDNSKFYYETAYIIKKYIEYDFIKSYE